jgi:hypothetical protein
MTPAALVGITTYLMWAMIRVAPGNQTGSGRECFVEGPGAG